ncbi:DNA-binding protein [Bacteroides fragilis]
MISNIDSMKNELTSTSDVDKVVLIGDEYVSQVRTFGALGYSAERICNLLGLRGKEKIALTIRIGLSGDVYNDAYSNGRALGEYNIDAELAKRAEAGEIDAITALETRKNERIELELRKNLFGV